MEKGRKSDILSPLKIRNTQLGCGCENRIQVVKSESNENETSSYCQKSVDVSDSDKKSIVRRKQNW
ncbi:17063_t:CDS:1, partial [Gigaspora rosea]